MPELSSDAAPEFVDAASCKAWLEHVPLANVGVAQQHLLAYAGLRMFHHYRAYREIPAQDWRALHESYAKAEELEVSEEPVKDFLNRDVHDTSPRAAYARAVLMHMSNPNELTQRQLTFVAFLLERWAAKLEVLRDPIDEGDGLPLAADLAGERCPERVAGAPPQARAGIRYLDARKLAKSLKNRIGLLRKGESPAQLSMGEDCVQPSCEQLLVFLFRQWGQPKAARVERRAAGDAAKVSSGLQAIHCALSGKRFRDPGERREQTPKKREEMETLGWVSRREEA